MKKFIAIMLATLMLAISVPFAVFAETDYTEIDTVEELAAIKDGKYWLAADIDLSKASWTTIKEFSGILDGNGHKIVVPANTVLFDTVTGTVKNVNLVSASKVTLENDDNSEFKTPGNAHEAGLGLGLLANVARGALIENVHTNIEANYKQASGLGVHVGGLIGIALSDYTVDGNNIVFGDNTVIRNCSTDGSFDVDWRWDNSLDGHKVFTSGFGGIVGYVYPNTVIEGCVASLDFDFYKNRARAGGILGEIIIGAYGSYDNLETALKPVEVKNCVFDGRFTDIDGAATGYSLDQIGGIAGYANGCLTITNCVFAGELDCANGSGGSRHILGYSNVANSPIKKVTVQGCISVGKSSIEGTVQNQLTYGKGAGFFALNNFLAKDLVIEIVDGGSNGAPDLATQLVGNTEYDTAAAAAEAFVKANSKSFKLEGGKIVLIQPEFTPATQPPQLPTVVPTGDITVYLAVITVISLAALTVVAKKRLSE